MTVQPHLDIRYAGYPENPADRWLWKPKMSSRSKKAAHIVERMPVDTGRRTHDLSTGRPKRKPASRESRAPKSNCEDLLKDAGALAAAYAPLNLVLSRRPTSPTLPYSPFNTQLQKLYLFLHK